MYLPTAKEDFNLKRIPRQPLVRELFQSCCLQNKYTAIQNELSLYHTCCWEKKFVTGCLLFKGHILCSNERK